MSKPLNTGGVGFDVALEVKNACLCLHVQRAARALARLFDEAFRPVGITNGQFSLLMSLNRPRPARMREVAALLAMDRTTLTAALKTLERRGLLAVAVDPQDRRGRLLTLTDAGRDVLARALPIWRDEHAKLERGLADADGLRATLLAIS
jgi:DNA-binding MarR family transcriptional regulator